MPSGSQGATANNSPATAGPRSCPVSMVVVSRRLLASGNRSTETRLGSKAVAALSYTV